MNNRIALVLKAKNISSSILADDLGVQRSGISHILNGRNKPSLEFIQKLIKLYPDISIQWILFGEGPMMNPYPLPDIDVANNVQPTVVIDDKPKPLIMELFSTDDEVATENAIPERDMTLPKDDEMLDNQPITASKHETVLESGKNKHKETEDNIQLVKKEQEINPGPSEGFGSDLTSSTDKNKKPDKLVKPDRKISKIVVFYNDRTFIEYSPAEELD